MRRSRSTSGTTGADVKGKVHSGPNSNWTIRGCEPKLGEWLQHISGRTSEVSVQKSSVLETAKILHRTLKLPGL